MPTSSKAKELLDAVNAKLGPDVLMLASDPKFKVTYLPTGVAPVDAILHGGLPRGRFVVVTGDWSTLKSYIGLNAIATTQRNGGTAALIDTEHAFDPDWAREIGVDVDALILQRPETGELAIDAAEVLIRGGIDQIVFDSVAATLPQAERNKRLHDENVQPARIAQLMSVAMRKLTAANSQTSVLWINQLRMNIGVTFGNPEVATGGKALPYYASIIVNVRKAGKISEPVKVWDGEKNVTVKEVTGSKFRIFIEKSKLNAPYREMYFTWDQKANNIDTIGFVIAQAVEAGVVIVKGNTWAFKTRKAVGREKFKTMVANDPALAQAIADALPNPIILALPGAKKPTPGKRRVVRKRSS